MAEGGEVEKAEDFSFAVSVSAELGEDVILPVHLSPDTSAVSMNISWYRESQLIYQYKDGLESPSIGYENRASLSVQELERGNLSLTLRNVQESDSGDYTLQLFQHGCLKIVIIHLQVRGDRQLQREIKDEQREKEERKLDRPIMKLELEKQIMKLELEKQIMKLELEKRIKELELEKRIKELELEKRIKELELEKRIKELEMEKQIKELQLEKQIRGLELEKQIRELEQEKCIKKLEEEKQINQLEAEKQIKELEEMKQIKELELGRLNENLERELSSLTHALHGPTPRRRNSLHGIPPLMNDDGTPETPETEEERETMDTVERVVKSGDQNIR